MQTQGTVELPDELDAALGSWLDSGQSGDPARYLQDQGISLPQGAEVSVRPLEGTDEGGFNASPKKTCHEVCINIGVVKYCYERCR